MVHAALLLLMLEAANADLVFTISLKRSTPNLLLSTSRPITPSLGLGRVKTPTPVARVENLGAIAHHKSQIMLRTNGSMPRKGILFSTFFQCMSFHTG
jgi:hypothetical protein